jgi:hypothetical protein
MNETEADTRANRIDPVLRVAGWGEVEGSKMHRELICPGRITGGGGRANPLSAGYVLSYRDRKLVVIEAEERSSYANPLVTASHRAFAHRVRSYKSENSSGARERLDGELDAERLDHLGDRGKAWLGAGPKRFVKALPTKAARFRDLGHASRLGHICQRGEERIGVVFFDRRLDVLGDHFFAVEVLGGVE